MNTTNQGTLTKSQLKNLENGIDRINAKFDWFTKNQSSLTQSQWDNLKLEVKNIQEKLNSFNGSQHNYQQTRKSDQKRKKGSNTNLLLGFILNADKMVAICSDIASAKVESDFKLKQAKKAEMKRTIEAIRSYYDKPQRSWDYYKSQ